MIDLVSIFFVKSFGLTPCTKLKHQHVISVLKDVNKICLKIYEFFHLKLFIINWYNYSFNFVQFFLAINCSSSDSQVLLEHLTLKDFKINIYNKNDFWEFEFKWHSHITVMSLAQFTQELSSQIKIFEIKTVFKSCDDKDFDFNILSDFHHISAWLCQWYSDFFDVSKTIQQPAHHSIDHAIELKPGTESSYMCMYNMSSAKLKVLDIYLTEVLERD